MVVVVGRSAKTNPPGAMREKIQRPAAATVTSSLSTPTCWHVHALCKVGLPLGGARRRPVTQGGGRRGRAGRRRSGWSAPAAVDCRPQGGDSGRRVGGHGGGGGVRVGQGGAQVDAGRRGRRGCEGGHVAGDWKNKKHSHSRFALSPRPLLPPHQATRAPPRAGGARPSASSLGHRSHAACLHATLLA